MSSLTDKIVITLRCVFSLFARADYTELEKMSRSVRLTASEMELAIKEYGSTIVMPPDNVLESPDIIEIEGATPKAWSIRLDLWTEQEGQSDLSLELTLVDSEEELLTVEFDNLHVL